MSSARVRRYGVLKAAQVLFSDNVLYIFLRRYVFKPKQYCTSPSSVVLAVFSGRVMLLL